MTPSTAAPPRGETPERAPFIPPRPKRGPRGPRPRSEAVNGFVAWSGPSLFEPAERVAVVMTGLASPSQNTKTGPMLQAYILGQSASPAAAIKSGADAAVCGACPLRPYLAKRRGPASSRCYVSPLRGPLPVWRAWEAGRYPAATPGQLAGLGAGRLIRLGAWGDPAAVPLEVWTRLLSRAAGWTGYTRRWMDPAAQGLRPFVMASVHNEREQARALAMGWRVFRMVADAAGEEPPAEPGAVNCPASDEAGRRATCATCRLCDGVRPEAPDAPRIVWTYEHGAHLARRAQ